MPVQLGDTRAELVRCFDLASDAALWILHPERLRTRPDVRALIDALIAQLA